ncbi:unnamed protein product [Pleuronectes platessa]|uniref:Uncharacterized protein n=1 Tax=Pleuronectes platessa TaxID=8262 RepID=A0A9N7URZ4_PLEPL|nr:unnamed protein product [Pleuronectes platessa]
MEKEVSSYPSWIYFYIVLLHWLSRPGVCRLSSNFPVESQEENGAAHGGRVCHDQSSDFQPVCRGTLVCREISLGARAAAGKQSPCRPPLHAAEGSVCGPPQRFLGGEVLVRWRLTASLMRGAFFLLDQGAVSVCGAEGGPFEGTRYGGRR